MAARTIPGQRLAGVARPAVAIPGGARRGERWQARLGGLGAAISGVDRLGWPARAWHCWAGPGKVGNGPARQERRSQAWRAEVWTGQARQDWHGEAVSGLVESGMVRQAWTGQARQSEERLCTTEQGEAGGAMRYSARGGMAFRGAAVPGRCGEAGRRLVVSGLEWQARNLGGAWRGMQ